MIKKVLISDNRKKVFFNAFALFVIQGVDYILPLLLFPYLVHTLGIELFGLLAFSTATVAFLGAIVSYGFNLSGTQQIAINKANKNKIDEIFNSIILVKLILLIISFFILLLMTTFIDRIATDKEVFFATFLLVVGEAIFPIWFFQGIEKMKFITYFRIGYKLLYAISIFIFVKSAEDYLLVPLLNGIGAILSGVVALFLIRKKFDVVFKFQKTLSIIFQFQNSWHIFISQIAGHFYVTINIFVLGMLSTNENVGYYSLAFKVYQAFRGLLKPVNQALFPFLSKKYIKNKTAYYKLVKQISMIYVSVLVVLSVLLSLFSQEIIRLLAGVDIPESSELLQIFSITILFAVGSFFTSLLIIKLKSKKLSKITFYTMILNMVMVYPVITLYDIYGLAYLVLLTQVFQAFLQVKYNKEIWKK